MKELNIVDRLENPEIPYSWELRADAAEEIKKLHKQLDAKQARIDELMMEYCPEEITQAQWDEWGKHQKPVEEKDRLRIQNLNIFDNPE